jgi:hypothetical protein
MSASAEKNGIKAAESCTSEEEEGPRGREKSLETIGRYGSA